MKLVPLAILTRYEVGSAFHRRPSVYSTALKELINLVKHMKAYPNDSLGESLRNVFDFDAFRPEMMGKLVDILEKHKYVNIDWIYGIKLTLRQLRRFAPWFRGSA